MSSTYLLVGASRGIGAAVAGAFAPRVDTLLTASRTPSTHGQWIETDISTDTGMDAICNSVGDRVLDALLFLGDTWEQGAFVGDYDFLISPATETRQVISVYLIGPILLAQRLTSNLANADNPRIILLGSSSGLDGAATTEVAYTASEFGLRGAAQALSIALRESGNGVTLINPDNVATSEVKTNIQSGAFAEQVAIPLDDLVWTIEYLLEISADTTCETMSLVQRRT